MTLQWLANAFRDFGNAKAVNERLNELEQERSQLVGELLSAQADRDAARRTIEEIDKAVIAELDAHKATKAELEDVHNAYRDRMDAIARARTLKEAKVIAGGDV